MSRGFPPRSEDRALVLSPRDRLVAGGPAEHLEHDIQQGFAHGVQRIVIDLRLVPDLDSAGVRALVRGHTTAERLGRDFVLVAPLPRVVDVLRLTGLHRVLTIVESLSRARSRTVPWPAVLTTLMVIAVSTALVAVGYWWPPAAEFSTSDAFGGRAGESFPASHSPLFELSKLAVAAVIGMVVTMVQRSYRGHALPNPTLEQAQVLLCVAGALMMIIIGSSLARAFGIAGAAAIIRFRTPVEDARDITVLFLLMGLGMAAGLGGFAVAGLGTLFLCAMFPVLQIFSSTKPRQMIIEIVAADQTFPANHVQTVFALNHVVFELREIAQGDHATARYLTTLGPNHSIEDLSQQLIADHRAGIKSVSWAPPKRG